RRCRRCAKPRPTATRTWRARPGARSSSCRLPVEFLTYELLTSKFGSSESGLGSYQSSPKRHDVPNRRVQTAPLRELRTSASLAAELRGERFHERAGIE